MNHDITSVENDDIISDPILISSPSRNNFLNKNNNILLVTNNSRLYLRNIHNSYNFTTMKQPSSELENGSLLIKTHINSSAAIDIAKKTINYSINIPRSDPINIINQSTSIPSIKNINEEKYYSLNSKKSVESFSSCENNLHFDNSSNNISIDDIVNNDIVNNEAYNTNINLLEHSSPININSISNDSMSMGHLGAYNDKGLCSYSSINSHNKEENIMCSKSVPSNMITTTNNNVIFSIYVENKKDYSIVPTVNKPLYTKTNEKWVDSSLVNKCQNCSTSFGFLTRKHHSRSCGGVFCTNCCNKYVEIPNKFINKPKIDLSYRSFISNSYRKFIDKKKELVCSDCSYKILQLLTVENLIKIFSYLDLKDLYKVMLVCKNYNIAATYHITKFRDIQYKTNESLYNNWEINILWNMRNYFSNHNIWFNAIIKSIYCYTMRQVSNRIDTECSTHTSSLLHDPTHNNNRLEWLYILLYNNKIIKEAINNNEKLREFISKNCFYKRGIQEAEFTHNIKIKCWSLLCSRRCSCIMDTSDIIDILEYITNIIGGNIMWNNKLNKSIIILLTLHLICINSTKKYSYIPLLCKIFTDLFDKDIFIDDIEFINLIYNTIFINCDTKFIYCILYEKKYIESINISSTYDINHFTFYKNLSSYINIFHSINIIKRVDDMIRCIDMILSGDIINIGDNMPFINPFNPDQMITRIIKSTVINSYTKPILIECEIDNNNLSNFKFIIKKDSNLRKEQIISSLITTLQKKIHSMGFSIDEVPSYQIIILSKDIGLIEFINDSITLRMVNEMGYSLQNYISYHNKNCTIEFIKRRFVNSLSISSAISYIIGLGDRHLDNIMICNNGVIFNIDYGYIMEQPLTLFEMPQIKITSDIIDMLEGTNSTYYDDFKKLVITTYNIMRANKIILYQYFKFISDEKMLNWNVIKDKLDIRTMIGSTNKDIEITLINEIENSNSKYNKMADICHMYRMKFMT